jgi:hypothetical protein
MRYDYRRLFAAILDSLAESGSATERMRTVVDECDRQNPHPDWEVMRKIDFESDFLRAEDWIGEALHRFEGDDKLHGIWFGLHNPIYEGEETADLYVGASSGFDDASIDWACDLLPVSSSPRFRSHALNSIHVQAYKTGELRNDAEYSLILAFGAMLSLAAMELIDALKFPSLAGAAVGFDSGDFLFLGRFSGGKFVRDFAVG